MKDTSRFKSFEDYKRILKGSSKNYLATFIILEKLEVPSEKVHGNI